MRILVLIISNLCCCLWRDLREKPIDLRSGKYFNLLISLHLHFNSIETQRFSRVQIAFPLKPSNIIFVIIIILILFYIILSFAIYEDVEALNMSITFTMATQWPHLNDTVSFGGRHYPFNYIYIYVYI